MILKKMFFNTQTHEKQKLYFSYLKAVCSLSNLFSNSKTPYLYYRVAETIFCKAFDTENFSRNDLAYDSKSQKLGIGLKTFICEGKFKTEKVAEFNSVYSLLKNLNKEKLASKISELRNERIELANRIFKIENAVYHCVARESKLLKIFETPYSKIEINSIQKIRESQTGLSFSDGKNDYTFNFSKSTLFRKFEIPEDCFELEVEILEDPLELILELFQKLTKNIQVAEKDFVVLPLYSFKNGEKFVFEKSGLNQWNAGGRKRDFGEVYIPIPKEIHKNFLHFFPNRDEIFKLQIPDGEIFSAKVCQDNSKALMTNPNKALSDWILRKILKLKEGEILTYERLKILGIDAVKITKIDDRNFKIDFAGTDSYENFLIREF